MSNYTFYADRPVEKYRRTDKVFLVTTILLWGIGMFTLYITTTNTVKLFDNKYYFVQRQLISSAIGFAGLVFMSLIPMDKLRKLLPVIVIGSLLLCMLTFVPGIGIERNGSRRWIRLPFLSTFQPSEAAKFAVVLFLANLFDKQNKSFEDNNQISDQNRVLPAIIGLVVFVLLIFLQKDFSTGMLVFVTGILMFFITGAKLSWLGPFTILAIPAAILMISIEPYRIKRVAAFLRPDEFAQTEGYQLFASKRAISSGGLWGNGFGSGLVKINNIPEVQADYIFAGWTEAMGLIGVIIYFIILVIFAWRAILIFTSTPDRFAAYASAGFIIIIVVQSLLNCAVVCGAVPTTGINLPFFSSGGSSIIFTLCMCGFILNASHCDSPELNYGNERRNERKEKINELDEIMVDL